jgi:hypothetical protein
MMFTGRKKSRLSTRACNFKVVRCFTHIGRIECGATGLILVGVSGGVGGYLDDEVGIEGHADPF